MKYGITVFLISCLMNLVITGRSNASFHLWDIAEIYSNADGTIQFIELYTNDANQGIISNQTLSAESDGNTVNFVIPSDVDNNTSNRRLLFATAQFSKQIGAINPDFVIPDQFFDPNANSITINFANVDSVTLTTADIPTDGYHSINDDLIIMFNSPTNFANDMGVLNDVIFFDAFEPCELAYPDNDLDTYGDINDAGTAMCVLTIEFVYNNMDCNDADGSINPSQIDIPDNNRIDVNCDGIDGSISDAIFVSTSGNTQNDGTIDFPLDTINEAITQAILQQKTEIYVAIGVYPELVQLADGISIYGGYDDNNLWDRGFTHTEVFSDFRLENQRVGVNGADISTPTTIDFFSITTANTDYPGATNYGLRCINCNGLIISNNIITAGNGNGGAPGQTGQDGSNGITGNNGTNGCQGTNCGFGGAQTNSPVGEYGGKGGDGGYDSNSGQNGSLGSGGASVGQGGSGSSCFGGGNNGSIGFSGAEGIDGSPGNNGIGFVIINDFWVGNPGSTGSNGTHGKGGSGGGGGGGGDNAGGVCNSDKGGGGGGGGTGGQGGTGGTGGQAGGSSFAIFLLNSFDATLQNNTLIVGNPGIGGPGGNGGNGGTGGTGGSPGMGNDDSGNGGSGGDGGDGGQGGNGGKGADGIASTTFIQ